MVTTGSDRTGRCSGSSPSRWNGDSPARTSRITGKSSVLAAAAGSLAAGGGPRLAGGDGDGDGEDIRAANRNDGPWVRFWWSEAGPGRSCPSTGGTSESLLRPRGAPGVSGRGGGLPWMPGMPGMPVEAEAGRAAGPVPSGPRRGVDRNSLPRKRTHGPWVRFRGSEAGPVGLAGEAGALCHGFYVGKVPPPSGAGRRATPNCPVSGNSALSRSIRTIWPGISVESAHDHSLRAPAWGYASAGVPHIPGPGALDVRCPG